MPLVTIVIRTFFKICGSAVRNTILNKTKNLFPAKVLILLIFTAAVLFRFTSLASAAENQDKQTRSSGLDSLISLGQDPRISRKIPEGKVPQVISVPTIREVKVPTEPRRVRLQNREAVIFPNIQMHPSSTTTQSEMSIWTHPINPDVALAGSNAVHTSVSVGSQGWYYTTDGGTSWSGGDTLPTHSNLSLFMADPAVGIDLDGNLFFNALLFGSGSRDVIIARSTNNGVSWTETSVPSPSIDEDKNHLAVDINPGSPFENNLYTAYTDFAPFPSPVMFSRSTNRGVSFTSPVPINGSIGSQFAQGINLAVGPNGELNAAWSGYDSWPPPLTTRLGFNKSTDGGVTWGVAKSLTNVNDLRGTLNKGGNFIRVSSFPSMAVDRSTGPRQGWIYIVYPAKNPSIPDIFLVRSTDGGTSWSSPVKVNQDNSGNDQWYPWITVDPTTGVLYVVYYDSRNFPANDSAQVYISSSLDGGVTFEPDVLVSDVVFLPTPIPGLAGGYMGDYIGISAVNGVVWPCWNDNRTGIHQAYTSRIEFIEVGSPPKISVSPETLDFGDVFLGYPETLSVNVRNLGFPETLSVTDIQSDNSDFTPELTAFLVPGGGSRNVKAAFSPSDTGLISGTLTISSNDTTNPTVTVALQGMGLIPPDISVSPESLSADLFTGEMKTETLTISNSGGSDLDFNISIENFTVAGSTISVKPPSTSFKVNLNSEAQIQEKRNLTFSKFLKKWNEYRSLHRENIKNVEPPPLKNTVGQPPLPVVIEDPLGDGGVVDITTLRGASLSNELKVKMEFSTTINPFDFGGFLSLDIDQDKNTGVSPSFGLPGQDIGVEYEFLFFNIEIGVVDLYNAVTATYIGSYPVTIGTNTLDFSAPLSDIGNDDGNMDVTGVVGNAFGPTDWFPDSGHGTIGSSNWLSANPVSGTIPAGSSMDISVTFDATGLNGGDYYANLMISSNDPDEPQDTTPVHLHVTGAPDIAVSKDTLDYSSVFIGASVTETLVVSNIGTDLLTVSNISSDNAAFTVDTITFSLNPGEKQNVLVTFTPSDTGLFTGQLTINSNDPIDSMVKVELRGVGLLPPDIVVSPESLSADLFTGEMVTETLTISNTGYSDLNFDISIEGVTAAMSVNSGNLSSSDNNENPKRDNSKDVYRTDLKDSETTKGSQKANPSVASVPIPFFDSFEDGNYDGWTEDYGVGIREVTNATAAHGIYSFHYQNTTSNGHFQGIHRDFNPGSQPEYVSFYVRSGSTSLADAYFVLAGDNPNTEAIFFFASDNGFFYINGDVGGDYSYPYNANQWYFIEFKNIDWVNKNFDYYVDRSLVKADIGFRFAGIANQFSRLYLYNFHASNAWWDGINIGSIANWISTNPTSGTVPAGGSMDIEVTFDATGLNGGDYYANILISSNDPDEPQDTTPVHLHVTGAPDIAVSDTILDYGSVFTVSSATETLEVSNIGTDLLTVSNISSDNAAYTVDTTTFSLNPGEKQNVLVTFTPVDTGLFTGHLTIISDDPDEDTVMVLLSGKGLLPPDISVTPESFSESLFTGEMVTETLTISNTGFSDLDFTIKNQPASLQIVKDQYTLHPSTPVSKLPVRTITILPTNTGKGNLYDASQVPRVVPVTIIDSSLHILTIDLGLPENYQILDLLGIAYVKLSPAAFDTVNLFNYDVLYVGWTSGASFIGMQSLYNRKNDIGNFVQAGGGLVALSNVGGTPFAWQWIPVTVTSVGIDANLVHIIEPAHPVMDSLTDDLLSNWDNSYHNTFTAYDPSLQSLAIATDGGNEALTLAGELGAGRIVLTGQDPDWHFVNIGDPGAAILLKNMLRWVGKGVVGWLSETPTNGTVPAGSSMDIEVTFDATGLNGGDYYANILISSNDPDEDIVTVPATLQVFQCVAGDLTNDENVTLQDIIFLVDYIFRGGPRADCRGNVNADNKINLADIVYLVSYLFRQGPEPNPGCCL